MNTMRGRLSSYSVWQARDYLVGNGIGALVVVGVVALLPMWVFRFGAIRGGASPEDIAAAMTQPFDTLVGTMAALGGILAVAGFVSTDRQSGLTRFLFARPVSVASYYLQAWLVRGVCLIALSAVLVLIVNWWLVPVPWARALVSVAIAWVLVGGVGFLLSVLFARDGVVLIFVFLIPQLLQTMVGEPSLAPTAKFLLKIVPPMHKLAEIRRAFLGHTMPEAGDLWLVLIWGAVCVALATWLVRRLPLVR